jgi:hypothetical protein
MDRQYLEDIGITDPPELFAYMAGFYEDPETMAQSGQILREYAYVAAVTGITLATAASLSNASGLAENRGVNPNTLIPHSVGLSLNWLGVGLFQLGVLTSQVGAIIEDKRDSSTT